MSQLLIEVAPNQMVFDTSHFSQLEGFERYRELYSEGADVFRIGSSPRARVEAWRLDRMLLYDRRINDIGHSRDEQRVAANGLTHFTATLLLAGSLEHGLVGEARPLQSGEIVLSDMRAPGENRMRDAHLVTLSIARERMAAVSGDLTRLHGLHIGGEAARLFRDFIDLLLRNLPTMQGEAIFAATTVLVTLLTAAIDSTGVVAPRGDGGRDAERLGRLRRMIDARITDPDFDPASAIRASGLSRASIYRLLEAQGGLAALIRQRRLEQVRLWLADARERRPFAELAHAAGLASVSHASDAFAARYGVRPSEYRRILAAEIDADALMKMRFWQEEVR